MVALALGAVFLLVVSGGATGTPSVSTDKDEYLYGETALISGLDFQPGQTLDVTVQQPDGSIVKGDGTQTPGWDVVTADGAGAFTLPWVVNGPHGEYTVRVYDHGDTGHTTVLATTVFVDDTPYPSSVSVTVVGLTASVSGTWDWTANCATTTRLKKHVGFAVDWGDGTGVPNVSPPPSTHLDGVYPTHMPAGTWDHCQPPGTGSFGTVSHTYATAGTFNICVITYDVHFVDPGPPPTSGNHSTDPRGSPEGGNSDNSYEQFPSNPSSQWKCQNTPVSSSADVKVTAVTVTAPGSASVGSPFNVTVTATIHNNGPMTPVNTDTTLDLGLPPDCSKSPSGTQLADNVSLATSTSQQVQATWSVTCTAPSAHTFSGSATIAIDQSGVTDSNPANDSASSSGGTNVTATSDVKVSGVGVSAPASAGIGSPFNVTATATLHNNGPYGPANVDTTLDLTVPADCTRSPNAAQSVQDTSLAVSAATPVQATWSVTCTAPSNHSFGGSATAAVDQLHVSDPTTTNNSGSGSAGTNVTATSDVKVSGVSVSAPASAAINAPFNVTATATLHNNGPYGPANVDTTLDLTVPADCTRSPNAAQSVQDTSLAVSAATPVQATWSVTCTSPSAHSFSVTADAAVDQLHVSDPNTANNSGTGSGGTNVTATSDVKVSGVSVSAPASAAINAPFNVTATATLHNNGPYGPANVDTTLDLTVPADCTRSPNAAQSVQDTSLAVSAATPVQATWSVTCTAPSNHSFGGSATAAIDQLHVSDPTTTNNSGSGNAGTNVTATSDVKVSGVSVSAPASAAINAPFNVTATATLHNNGPYGPANVDTTFTLSAPADCTIFSPNPQVVQDTSLAASTATTIPASPVSWQVSCADPSAHSFSVTAGTAVDQLHVSDPNTANNSGSGSGVSSITAISDIKMTAVTAMGPGSSSINTPFTVTGSATIHNFGPYGPTNVDVDLTLSLPPDCTTSSPNPQTVQDTSLAVSSPVIVPASPASWTVSCSSPSTHQLTVTGCAQIDQAHVTDPDTCSNSASANVFTVITAPTDVKVSGVVATAPASVGINTPFTVTGSATIHNNGPYSPVNVDTTFTLTMPGDCTTSSSNPVSVQNAPLSTSVAVTVPASPVSWTVTCTSPSAHAFTVTADAAVDQIHVIDTNTANNSNSANATTNVTATSDVKVSGVSVSAPASASAGTPFNVTATATLHNNGPYGPANVDTTFTLSLPGDCTTSSANPQMAQDTSLPTSTATTVPTSPAAWSVTCTSPSAHSFSVTAGAAVDQLHVSDPNTANNSGTGSGGTNVTATSDVKVSGVSVSAPASAAVGSPFNVTVGATLHNNGTFGPANVDTTLDLTVPGDCTRSPNAAQSVQDTSLAVSAATPVQATWSVTCTAPSNHSFGGSATAAVDQLHVSDPTTTNNSDSGSGDTVVGGQADLKVTGVTVTAPASGSVNAPFNVTVDATVHNNGPVTPATADVTLNLSTPGDCTKTPSGSQSETGLSLAQSASTPVSKTWSVTCTNPSSHSFGGSASVAPGALHLGDPDTGNNSGSGSAGTSVTATSDVKVSGVAVSTPGSAAVGSPFNVTATATLHNNGSYGPANVDTTLSLSLPPDCTTSSANPQTAQDSSLPTSTATAVPASPATWSVTCTSPSAHSFSVTADATVDQLHVSDPTTTNNSGSGSAGTNVTATSDVKVSGVSVSAPASASAGTPFNVTVGATLHNNGSYGPANVDTTLDLTVPGDCTRSPNAAQSVQDTSLAVSATTPVQATWSVTCTAPSNHSFGGSATAAVDQLHVSDPTTTNNSGSGSAATAVSGSADVKVSGVTVTAPASASVNTPFNVTVDATVHNNGPVTPATADVTVDLTVPGDCTKTPSGSQAQTGLSLAQSASTPVSKTWSVTCTSTGMHTFTGNGSITLNQLHVNDPNATNNTGQGTGSTDIVPTTVNFTVHKDFNDNNPASVTVSLTCGSGTVSPTSASASESSPAVFTVTGATGDPTCTATESPIPSGYSSTGNCSATLSVGQCTIVNILITPPPMGSFTFMVFKDFNDNNPASVTVSLSCESGTVSPASASASESSPAVFTVTDAVGDPTCTATESPIPSGYSSTGNCSAPGSVGQCTITNTLLPPGGGGTPNPVGGVLGLIDGDRHASADGAAPGGRDSLGLLLVGAFPFVVAAAVWIGRRLRPN